MSKEGFSLDYQKAYEVFKDTMREGNYLLSVKSALEKQIPKKTTKREYVPNGTLIYGYCPNCDCSTRNFFEYCGHCGQALDWSDTE